MIQSMYIQSGEWVIISKVSKYIRTNMLRSLRFRIIVIIIIAGIIPGLIMKAVILNSYEKRAVEVRTAEIDRKSVV